MHDSESKVKVSGLLFKEQCRQWYKSNRQETWSITGDNTGNSTSPTGRKTWLIIQAKGLDTLGN